MAFNGFRTKKDEPIDDDRKLLCTVSGCQNLWSVDIDRKRCSYHQWIDRKPLVYSQYHDFGKKYEGDPKGWAKRIIDKHNAGMNVLPLPLQFAKDALK